MSRTSAYLRAAHLTYLDSDMVLALGKRDMPDKEMRALDKILQLADNRRHELRTSVVTLKEVEVYRRTTKGIIRQTYDALEKVPYGEDHTLLGFNNQWSRNGGISTPLIEDDAVASRLRAIGLKRG